MLRQATKRLLIAVGLALLWVIAGAVLPFRAAPSSLPVGLPNAEAAVQATTPLMATPTPTSTRTTPPTPSLIEAAITYVSHNGFLVASVCLLSLMFLGLLLAFLVIWRRRRRKPTPSPAPTVLSPPSVGAYLESGHALGGPRRFELKPEGVTIGRASANDLVITQDYPGWESVSQRHAWIYRWANYWIIEDIKSRNGVYVNGRRTGRNLLQDGWQLEIGKVDFVFHTNTGE